MLALGCLLASLQFGCSSAVAVFPTAQSHHIPVDARVTPLGQAEATSEHFEATSGGLVDLLDPNNQQAAIQEAIKKKQGDALTNYVLSLYAVRAAIPGIDIITFWWVHWKVEGTVVKVERGTSLAPSQTGSPPLKLEQEPRR
jgi:hypothetical protein